MVVEAFKLPRETVIKEVNAAEEQDLPLNDVKETNEEVLQGNEANEELNVLARDTENASLL